jgi:glutathione synthase/RimK-type ligase-like ATP-grasp enzyme
MRVGIVTIEKKPREGSGLEDVIKELENRKMKYSLIHPQDIFWEDGEYCLFHQKRDGYEVSSLREETGNVDIFYIRSILGKSLAANFTTKESFKVNLRLDSIESLGKPIVNEPEAMKKARDKSWACRNLYDLGVIPKTTVFSLTTLKSKEPLKNAVSRALKGKRNLIIKPTDSTGGDGCIYIEPGLKFRPFIDTYRYKDLLMQDKIEGPEYRFWMIGTKCKGAIERKPCENDFRANTSCGGEEKPYKPLEDEINLALLIHKRHGLEISALDLKRDVNSDSLKLLEINDHPGWKTHKRVYGTSLASDVIDHLEFKYNLQKHEI